LYHSVSVLFERSRTPLLVPQDVVALRRRLWELAELVTLVWTVWTVARPWEQRMDAQEHHLQVGSCSSTTMCCHCQLEA
jgi:hypothetical protein